MGRIPAAADGHPGNVFTGRRLLNLAQTETTLLHDSVYRRACTGSRNLNAQITTVLTSSKVSEKKKREQAKPSDLVLSPFSWAIWTPDRRGGQSNPAELPKGHLSTAMLDFERQGLCFWPSVKHKTFLGDRVSIHGIGQGTGNNGQTKPKHNL